MLTLDGVREPFRCPTLGDLIIGPGGQDGEEREAVWEYGLDVRSWSLLHPSDDGGQLEDNDDEFETVNLESRRVLHGSRCSCAGGGVPDDLEPQAEERKVGTTCYSRSVTPSAKVMVAADDEADILGPGGLVAPEIFEQEVQGPAKARGDCSALVGAPKEGSFVLGDDAVQTEFKGGREAVMHGVVLGAELG